MNKNPVAITMVALFAIAFVGAGILVSSVNRKTAKSLAGGTVESTPLEDGTTRYQLEGCRLPLEEELLDLLVGSRVSQITLRKCTLSVAAVDVLVSLGTLRTLTVDSPEAEEDFDWLIFGQFMNLKKLTMLNCDIGNAQLAQLHQMLPKTQVVPSLTAAKASPASTP